MPRHTLLATLTIVAATATALPAQGDFKSVHGAVPVDGKLFFVADKSPAGSELWVLETGQSSARLVKDIHAGPGSSGIQAILAFGKRAAFVATDGKSGRELWVSDGTAEGTVMLKDIMAGAKDSGVDLRRSAVVAGSALYFFASDREGKSELGLWKTDGTEQGTAVVRRGFRGLSELGVDPDHRMTAMPGGLVVFRESTGTESHLWGTDGTEKGTGRLTDVALAKGSGPFGRFGEKLFFTAGAGEAWDIWFTDGTKAGTRKLHGAAADGDGKIGGPKTTKADRKLAMIHFVTYCATCHGRDGKGTGPAAVALNPKPRDWTDAKWQASVTDQRILKVVRDGGVALGLSPLMAPNPMYGKNPAVLKAIVEKIRSFDKKK